MIHGKLRREAGPLKWGELHGSQQEVFQQIVRAMADAAGQLGVDAGGARSGSRIDIETDRSSRLLFLSGERGTGKTSLLLTLQHLTSPGRRDSDITKSFRPRNASSEDAPKDAKDTPGPTSGSLDCLDTLRNSVVWLETLDMDTLPRPTNLLAAILVRIGQAMGEDSSADDGPHGRLNPLVDGEEALLELQRLQTDASLAWDGNIEQRAAQF